MRRRVDESQGGPAHLRRYVPAEWGHDPVAYWAAVARWRTDHPREHLEIEDGPDVPFTADDI